MECHCDLGLSLQISSIVAGVFGVIVSIVCMVKYFGVEQLILSLFGIVFSLVIIACEVYIFDFFKYFAFILTFWGKAIMYLFMGFFYFAPSGIGLVTAIIFWILFLLYIIFNFVLKSGASPPLFQKDSKPQFHTTTQDYYEIGPSQEAPPTAYSNDNNGGYDNSNYNNNQYQTGQF